MNKINNINNMNNIRTTLTNFFVRINNKNKNINVGINTDYIRKKSYVDCNNQFAYNVQNVFYKKYNSSHVFSPHSIMSALSTFYFGTSDETEKDFSYKLHMDDRINMINTLKELNLNMKKVKQHNIFMIEENYYHKLKRDYINKISDVNSIVKFSTKTEDNIYHVIKSINNFVEENTNKTIKNIVNEEMIKSSSIAILINCIYFKSPWQYKFRKHCTKISPFYDNVYWRDRTQKKLIEMMHNDENEIRFGNYSEDRSYALLEMEYEDNNYAFGIFLPKSDEIIPDIRTKDKLISTLVRKRIHKIEIPKFKQESEFDIKDILKLYKIECMNDGKSIQTDNMFQSNDIKDEFRIDKIIHKAVMIVDEQGTEASASTVITVDACSVPNTDNNNSIIFIANHPFTYYIRHTRTNTMIFSGFYK